MVENQKTITEWAVKTFGQPDGTWPLVGRAIEEVKELVAAYENNEGDEKIVKEIADIFIVLCQIPEQLGYDLWEAIDNKMAINRSRMWNTNGDGVGQHL
jgi:NTP pyrophosphatase (non-canonical NTP hydrolase)